MIPYGRQNISAEDIAAVTAVLQSDCLTQGPQVPLFEQHICAVTSAKFAVAANSATSMLHLACLALGVTKGDYVWTSPITFVASANCALYCGANIDFVDVDRYTGNMCPKALESKLKQAKAQNRLPKVLIPVHMAGHSCDMQAIWLLAKSYGVRVIEDASHGIGGSYQNRKIGTCQYSDITIFSFHPVKIITTAEGGVATTNDAVLAESMQLLRSHGITKTPQIMLRPDEGDWYYEQHALGFNYRMTELQAALGNSQINRLVSFVEQRNKLVATYVAELAKLNVTCVIPLDNSYSAYHLMIVLLPGHVDRKAIFEAMRAADICVHVHYFPVHLQPYYLNKGFAEHDFPEAEYFYQHCLTLPLFPDLTEQEQGYILDTLKGLL
ncbi:MULTISPECIES: UDP-4-amino-4,6-dideoxy-N-acetyl-beta-L-altrosamine transaminase [unclassified Shewanella]|uniref:UDP-4-amino-4, 6-dideoxy-N-acetyl-beta-L-altrosamine transaminase n=1 Tax=unclassified Shewanella TaxID=196818 RepID=UPI001BBD1BDF|nr:MULTISPECIES: UDP-4-amino-4,6-dideoxy-N-acetyl-beta-L-altrosamine transaminase [unclassified Shewanella]GIU14645.1 UDP-4-amino-4,6-dideoxy-N-acetyl-beta-L-altrosami ne transaminase [Shewanella sp. MBTL60-112-B1]GIU37818.1 UDP-4-amino-4,6-dideoxy-N-acetyl-beta-L-altrosami ne transaminase [Shewanella sp. MBTL60-112-B2]